MFRKIQFRQLAFLVLLTLTSCGSNDVQWDYKLIPVLQNDKWGYIDQEGNLEINPQYNFTTLFSEGLASVLTDEGFIYINEKGEKAFDQLYYDAAYFSEGLAAVVLDNGHPSFIDKSGKIKFEMVNMDWVGSFESGLAQVNMDNKWGFINKEGKIVINLEYDWVGTFQNGRALIKKDDLYGYIDEDGKNVINPQFEEASAFSETDGIALIKSGDNYGYIDKSGKIVINPQFEKARTFSEGLAVIQQSELYGYIDTEGKIVVNPQFEGASNFSNGLAKVKFNDKWGYISPDGKYAINPQFKDAKTFYFDVAVVSLGDKYGVIDLEGNYVVNPQYENLGDVYGYIWENITTYKLRAFTNTNVNSTYLDIGDFEDFFKENLNDGLAFGLFSDTTTYRDLDGEFASTNEESSTILTIEDADIISDYAEISGISIQFDRSYYRKKPKYKRSYDWYYGWQSKVSGYTTIYSKRAKVEKVHVDIKLTGRGEGKSEYLANALVELLESQNQTQAVEFGEGKSVTVGDKTVEIYNGENSISMLISWSAKVSEL